MALPSTWTRKGDGTPRYTGIGVNLIPGNVGYGTEVQRTSDDGAGSAASTGATSITELPPGTLPQMGRTIYDYLPMDNANRFYRARHIAQGYDAGSWTSWTTGHRPTLLDGDPRLEAIAEPSGYPLRRDIVMADNNYAMAAANSTGTQFAATAYLPSTMTITVGTTGTPSSITKTIRIPFTEMIPFDQTTPWAVWVPPASLRTGGAGGSSSLFYYAAAVFPKGVTLTTLRSRMFRESTAQVAITRLIRVNDDETATTLATVTHSASTWQTPSASLSQLVGDEAYLAEVELSDATTGLTGSSRWMWAEAEYTMPSYDKGY